MLYEELVDGSVDEYNSKAKECRAASSRKVPSRDEIAGCASYSAESTMEMVEAYQLSTAIVGFDAVVVDSDVADAADDVGVDDIADALGTGVLVLASDMAST